MVASLRNSNNLWEHRVTESVFRADTWYLLCLVTHLNWPAFFEKFVASSILQQFQVKSSVNTCELKWLNLWCSPLITLKTTTSCFIRTNDGAKFDCWDGRKTFLYFRLYGLHINTVEVSGNSHLGGIDDRSWSFWPVETLAKNWCWSNSCSLLIICL